MSQLRLTPQTKTSEHNFIFQKIFELYVQGGLTKANHTQMIEGRYYIGTELYTPKAVIKFGIADEAKGEFLNTMNEKPKAIRFGCRQNIRALIFNLLKLEVYTGRQEGSINAKNWEYEMHQDLELVEKVYRMEIQ